MLLSWHVVSALVLDILTDGLFVQANRRREVANAPDTPGQIHFLDELKLSFEGYAGVGFQALNGRGDRHARRDLKLHVDVIVVGVNRNDEYLWVLPSRVEKRVHQHLLNVGFKELISILRVENHVVLMLVAGVIEALDSHVQDRSTGSLSATIPRGNHSSRRSRAT